MTILLGAALLFGAGCKKKEEAKPADMSAKAGSADMKGSDTAMAGSGSAMAGSDTAAAAGSGSAAGDMAAKPAGDMKLFLDVHEMGPGKVKPADVAGAHAKDLAVEGKHGVEFLAYWLDEKSGTIYCLSKAPSAEAVTETHKEAHGLLPAKIMQVAADNTDWKPEAGKKLFIDVHEMGAGKVKAADVAGAHAKDLAVQDKHGVKFLDYFVDEASGTIVCVAQAAKAEDVIATHKEAHGLLPKTVAEVTEGR
jgi:hypothetical protein